MPSMANKEIGFVSLSSMGRGLANNFIHKGSAASAGNISLEAIAKLGAGRTKAARKAPRKNVIFSAARDAPAVRRYARDDDDVLAGSSRGTTRVDLTVGLSTNIQ